MPQVTCTFCGGSLFEELDKCPHCGRPSLFPNVLAASKPEEVSALRNRYDSAIATATRNGSLTEINEFEKAMNSSLACKAMPRWEIDRLVTSDSAIAATYYDQISGNSRIPDDNEWDLLRRVADAHFQRSYGNNIHFAALSIQGRWLESYGDGALFFHESMISHRSTLFETNTASMVDLATGALNVPPGHRSSWDDRAKLAMAKIGPGLVPKTTDFGQTVLCCGSSPRDDVFLEVHIYGPFTIRSAKEVVIKNSALSDLSRESLNERSKLIGFTVRIEK